jgi:hypothetical protein
VDAGNSEAGFFPAFGGIGRKTESAQYTVFPVRRLVEQRRSG